MPKLTRRGATLMMAGALGGCGGGWFEDDEYASLTSASAVPQPAPVPTTTVTTPSPSPPPPPPGTPGLLNRAGLQLTFADEFSALAQDFNQTLPLNGKWQTWLNNGGRDNFYSRTLHQKDGVEQQYYVDQYILNKTASHLAGAKTYDPFSLVDGPDGKKVLRITARRLDGTMVATLRDKIGTVQGLSSYEATKYWSSGVISTYQGFKQKYGVFEARVKISPLAGSWPAFWMLASDRGYSVWPPEIDIFDNYPQYSALNRWVCGGVITPTSGYGPKDGGRDGKQMPYNVRGEWRTIGIEWDAKNIVYYSDDIEFYRAPTPSNFHENMFLMLNLAIVGQDNSWADKPLSGTSTIDMDIAWVKAWKRV